MISENIYGIILIKKAGECSMLRIAICDDEIAYAEKLELIVDALFKEQKTETEIFVYNDPKLLTRDHFHNEFRLIFLDIDMPEISGIKLASMLRASKSKASLIFVSSHSHFVFETFRYSPFRFVRKDWLDIELPEAIQAFCSEVLNKKPMVRLILDDKKIITENAEEIIYFFSLRHDIYYLTPNGTKMLYTREYTMEKLEKMFLQHGFLRIHKTYLVNYRYIYQIGRFSVSLILEDSDELPISHRRSPDIRKQYQVLMRGENDI